MKPDFSLIETMRLEPETGIVRGKLHRARLRNSAKVLGFPGVEDAFVALANATAADGRPLRLRLELFPDGRHALTTAPFETTAPDTVWRIAIASRSRLSSDDAILRHKTSRRDVYNAARAEFPREAVDEVVLLNEKDEVCEGTITNIFVEEAGTLLTPPLASGCLAGVLRTSLVCGRKARSRRLTVTDLRRGPIYVGNSLRGLIRAQLMEQHEC